MKKTTLTALALASFGIGAAQAAVINGDFSTIISDPVDAQLDIADLDNGWQSFRLNFDNSTSGVATTALAGGTFNANGHIMAQVFTNTQTGPVALSFDWAPAASEELNYGVYGYNATTGFTGDILYLNAQFATNGIDNIGGGDTLVSTGVGTAANWTGVTGDTTSATFDLTGYNQVVVGFWQPTAGAGGVLDNVAITAIPEPSSTALLGLGGLALILRRRR